MLVMEEKLREAACFGDLDALTTLLNKGTNINAQHKINGWTALHWAAKRNNAQCVDILLSRGAEKTIHNSKGETPAMLTTQREILVRFGVPEPVKNGDSTHSPRPKTPKTPKSESHGSNANASFVPNYLKHPPLAHKVDVGPDVDKLRSRSADASQGGLVSSPAHAPVRAPPPVKSYRILKIRLVGKEHFDKDFIEVDIPSQELSFRRVIDVICDEFSVNPLTVLKVRKLPNTKLRRDVEVQRLADYQELEVEIADI
ncbi:ankyrin repeat domain-containing protein 40-like [Tigriopus californicus]|nr:ankyrin repeat domain-containing protein 40-like [Tigriopus californicus]